METGGKIFIFLILFFSCLLNPISENFNHEQIIGNNLNGQYKLFLLFDPKNLAHRFSIMYAQILWFRLKTFHLSVIGISTGNTEDAEEAQRLCRISFPVIQEREVKFIKKHNLNGCCGATMLVGPEQEIIFKENELLQSDLLRQLIERYLDIDEISKTPPFWHPPFFENQIIPDFTLYEINGQKKSLSDSLKKLNILTFFSSYSYCRTCKHMNRLETLQKIYMNSIDNMFIGIFFMEPFSTDDIKLIKSHQVLNFDTYLIQNFMPEDNIYITEENLKCDPWSVLIDNDRVVIWTEYPGLTEERIIKEITEKIKNFKRKMK
ncbi:MAG: peroxiredoxin family protein [Candidatus Saccharicenans sp.]